MLLDMLLRPAGEERLIVYHQFPFRSDGDACYTALANRNAAADLTSLLLSTSPQVLPIILAAVFDASDVFSDVPSDCWTVSDDGGG